MAATFIVVGIVLVPMVLLVADLLIGRDRLTGSTTPAAQRRQGR
jgi:hypothetical protein